MHIRGDVHIVESMCVVDMDRHLRRISQEKGHVRATLRENSYESLRTVEYKFERNYPHKL